ncbi:alpha/beta hydrolase fold domain-containing protein [Polyangium sp. 6x1]|uniref:alpha/beta hydrolase fold domain-containing protein n=1 Tax=Polyangium sp. 6x1 TaxID=3042689 RepID=UPI0024824954|nr:alpha/beta hydrolase fold domain-containing protein [Polyangium sp. 6x1]MDI1446117.1 alpha/beta hydrolase fold domain-containing protein [Polyangium sp. 6x1]
MPLPFLLPAPVLFLIAAGVGAMFTLNALRPARKFWPLVGAGFFASWLTGELAAHHLFWQAVATALFVWAGGLDGWPGWVALFVVSLSWIGLVRIVIDARKARDVTESALREGLGTTYRSVIPEEIGAHVDEHFSLRQRLFPLPVLDGRVEVVRDVVFSRVGGVKLRLDVYRPRGNTKPRPTVLFVHGGAWVIGSKDDQGKPLAYRLAAHGWVVVSANYRLSPRFTFPDHLIDVKSAIRWIREHGKEHGADPSFLVITGGSAGGHLAALAALTPNDPRYQPGFEDVDTRVQACVPFYGVYDFTDRRGIWRGTLLRTILEKSVMKKGLDEERAAFDAASPMSQVRSDAPPFFVVHGERDSLVPVQEARLFVELLRKGSRAPVLYAELPGAQHAFEVFPSERTGHALAAVERFLAYQWAQHRREVAGAERAEVMRAPDTLGEAEGVTSVA